MKIVKKFCSARTVIGYHILERHLSHNWIPINMHERLYKT